MEVWWELVQHGFTGLDAWATDIETKNCLKPFLFVSREPNLNISHEYSKSSFHNHYTFYICTIGYEEK